MKCGPFEVHIDKCFQTLNTLNLNFKILSIVNHNGSVIKMICPKQYPKTSNTILYMNIVSWLIYDLYAPYTQWVTLLMEVSTLNEVNATL